MKYELTFIISATIPETEHKKVEGEVLSYLKKSNAKVIKEPYSIGRKKLAYSINKQKYGFYTVIEFEIEDSGVLKELETELKYNNDILRHLIIKQEKETKVKKARKKEEKIEEIKEEKKEEKTEEVKEEKTEDIKEEKKEEKTEEVKEEKIEEIKLDLDDIDKKLDDILKE